MEGITSEVARLQNTTNTLLRSIEQLKDGKTRCLLTTDQSAASAEGPAVLRTSLPRKAKIFEKDTNKNAQKSNGSDSNSMCPCGNVAENKCKTKNCVKCCHNPSCEAKMHNKRKQKRLHVNVKKKLTPGEASKDVSDQSSDSSDEDLPLVNLKKKLIPEGSSKESSKDVSSKDVSSKESSKDVSEESSDSSEEDLPLVSMKRKRLTVEQTDEDWSPLPSKQRKENGRNKGLLRDLSRSCQTNLLQPTPCVPQRPSMSSLLQVERLAPRAIANSSKSYHQRMPLQPALSMTGTQCSSIRIPTLNPTLNPHMRAASSQPSMPLLTRLPFLRSPLEHLSAVRMPPLSALAPLSNSHQITDPTGANIIVHKPEHTQWQQGNCDKLSTDVSKEGEDANIRRFYVRYPSSQCCKQKHLVDIFKPYCSLRYIEWIDKRSAYVTIHEDATFQTYDGIFLNLVMKSDKENDNTIYVSPYSEVVKKHSVENINKKNEKK